DVAALVRELGGSRVEFIRHPQNIGFTGNMNACVQSARGHWVQILHDDDVALPGFYDAYRQLIEGHPEAVMIVGKVLSIDSRGTWLGIAGPTPSEHSPILSDFLQNHAMRQQGQFVSIAVRRSAYERVGGFAARLEVVNDWDMWFRLATLGPVLGTT